MGEMVKVQQEKIGEEVIQTVNARDLHEYLGIGRDFSSWIKERVDKYKFTEGKDYITCSPDPGSDVRVAHNRVEYHISIDMAKELSMVENNEKGRMARRYFIECEKKLSQSRPPKSIQDKSKEARKGIAAVWRERRASAPKHFIAFCANSCMATYKGPQFKNPRLFLKITLAGR